MGKYLKEFATHAEYQAYINGGEAILPNVSICDDQPTHVHYNPTSDWLSVTYQVVTTEEDTPLFDSYGMYGKGVVGMEVDGVMLSTVQNTYRFDTGGEHVVRYKLEDQTKINEYLFFPYTISNMFITKVEIPENYVTIEHKAICTSADEGTDIYMHSKTPPEVANNPFGKVRNIYVPAESVNLYKTAPNWSEYAEHIVAMP